MRYPAENKTNKKHIPPVFFGNPVQVTPFFAPVVQRQPASPVTKEQSADELMTDAREALADLEKIKQALQQGKKDLCTLSFDIFKGTVNTSSRIDKYTPVLLDSFSRIAANCSSLSPYITLKSKQIEGTGVYVTHDHNYRDDFIDSQSGRDRFDANDWHQAVKNNTGAKTREEILGVGGFYNRSKDTINLPEDGTIGSALHEAMHRMSGRYLRGRTSDFLSEGATQYFTDFVLNQMGLPKITGHKYNDQVSTIEKLVRKLGSIDLLAKVYFQDNATAFQEILVKLNIVPDMKTIIVGAGQKIIDAVK